MEYVAIYSDDALSHHGIKGQKWGVRRYQNPDGSLTPEGKEHYHKQINREARQQKAAVTAYGAYAGGVVGAAASMVSKTAALGGYVTPLALASTPAVVAGAAFIGAAGLAAISYKNINFKRDEAHMYVESGQYFMRRNIRLDN